MGCKQQEWPHPSMPQLCSRAARLRAPSQRNSSISCPGWPWSLPTLPPNMQPTSRCSQNLLALWFLALISMDGSLESINNMTDQVLDVKHSSQGLLMLHHQQASQIQLQSLPEFKGCSSASWWLSIYPCLLQETRTTERRRRALRDGAERFQESSGAVSSCKTALPQTHKTSV